MAAKKPSDFNNFLQQLQKETVDRPKVAAIPQRRYFLIVSEGKSTEPLYFGSFKKLLPKNLLDTIEVEGEGANTLTVVNQAIRMRDQRKRNPQLPPYDEVWAVFDKDDFPDKNFNAAVKKAEDQGINSGHSNQSFELWYVLHFQDLQAALHRDEYIRLLSSHMGSKYSKTDENILKCLKEKGNVENAIQRAHKLFQAHGHLTPSKAAPCTKLYLLVEGLNAYLENRKVRIDENGQFIPKKK